MASDGVKHVRQGDWPPVNPWHLTVGGLAVCALAWFLQLVQGWVAGDSLAPVIVPIRALLIFAGMVLASSGVGLRLRRAATEFEERAVSAALTSVAGFTALVAWLAMDDSWDSLKLLLAVLAVVAFTGVGLILLPRLLRRIVFLVIVFFHFGGILTAVTSAPPPGSPAPWITTQLWTRIYRPYLQFMYLNNAYHFYSPEPGPACQLWFYVKFTDGTGEWLKTPEKSDYATRQEYQRFLALTESTNHLATQLPPFFDSMVVARNQAGSLHNPPIKMRSDLAPAVQYRQPAPDSVLMTRSYARHVAQSYKSKTDPDKEVASVKVYRVQHQIVSAPEMAAGINPLDPTWYWPYFQGEFDKNGEMITKKDDPFLYWLIPIVYEPKPQFRANEQPAGEFSKDKYDIVDYCQAHAQSSSK
jgi:hypothetical protein